jgi:hypothetical protein
MKNIWNSSSFEPRDGGEEYVACGAVTSQVTDDSKGLSRAIPAAFFVFYPIFQHIAIPSSGILLPKLSRLIKASTFQTWFRKSTMR